MIRDLLSARSWLLADGATGTNYFNMGLGPGDPPEMWNIENADRVQELHRRFIAAGADIILTNTFGGTGYRLKLHHFEHRVAELNAAGVKNARLATDEVDRPVVVAGSVGPTGELLEPLGSMTYADAVAAFKEQIAALAEAGADVIWIETMSSPAEIHAAAEAAIACDMDYVFTASFDTAGKTMMGLHPAALAGAVTDLDQKPVAYGANCGVGASDLLCSVSAMTQAMPDSVVIAKANCGIPEIQGENVVYTGTPDLMARYAQLALDAGARIIGGCCGTSPDHLAAMRKALDEYTPSKRPDLTKIITEIGPLTNAPANDDAPGSNEKRPRRGGRRRR